LIDRLVLVIIERAKFNALAHGACDSKPNNQTTKRRKNSNLIDPMKRQVVSALQASSASTRLVKKSTMGFAALAVAALFGAASSQAAVIEQGNPYVPAGANFQIFGLQGVTPSTPLGLSGFNTQVNTNFEFTPSIGVSYDTGGAKLTDFGLGLYQPSGGAIQSTGLKIQYNQLVSASSITFTVEDFDIDGKATGFNSQKVEPTLQLLGAAGNIIASFTPAQIFPALVPKTGKASDDIWNVSVSQLLANAHLADMDVSGFVLAADMTAGEKANSDPYLLLSVGNGTFTTVPEASSFLPLVGVLGMVIGGRAVRRRFAAAA